MIGHSDVETGRYTLPPRHCDAQRMMHASRPAEYFEDAFLVWLDVVVGGYAELQTFGIDLVLAQVNTSFHQPILLGARFSSHARLHRVGRRSLTMAFELRVGDAVHVDALQTYVCVRDAKSADLPEEFVEIVSATGTRSEPDDLDGHLGTPQRGYPPP